MFARARSLSGRLARVPPRTAVARISTIQRRSLQLQAASIPWVALMMEKGEASQLMNPSPVPPQHTSYSLTFYELLQLPRAASREVCFLPFGIDHACSVYVSQH